MNGPDQDGRSPMVVADPSDRRFPVFPPDVLEELSEFGERRELAAGDVLYRAGRSNTDFFVLIDGEVEVVRDDESQELVVVYTAGHFVGELGLVTGQGTFLTARSTRCGAALVIPRESFRRLMATKPTISDVIFGALIARRETIRTTSAAQAIQIIGSRFSREALALRTFATRTRLPYTWIDLEEAEDVGVLLASKGLRIGDSPVVITPTGILRHPTPGRVRRTVGIDLPPDPRPDLRSGRHRHWSCWSRRFGLWGLRRSRYRLARRRRPRGPGRLQFSHRELCRVPERNLGG